MFDGNKPYISGMVFGHPKYPDDTLIYTSTVVVASGRHVVTYSGSCYELDGPPNASCLALFAEIHGKFDPDNPLKDYCKSS